MHSFMKTQSVLSHERGIQMHAGATAAWKQHKNSSVNCSRFQTTREVILSALFKRQLSGSQLSSRWDKNVLSFKPFCSTGAAHQFSHLHSRGDKGLAGKFIFAGGYTVLLSLYQSQMKRDSSCTKRRDLKCTVSRERRLITTRNKQGTTLREPAGCRSRSSQIRPSSTRPPPPHF